MEELLNPAVIAGLGSVASIGLEKLIKYLKIRPYLPLMKKTFELVDPILVNHMADYRHSDVRFAIGLAASVAADGNLTPKEVEMLVSEVQKRWLPSKAVQCKKPQTSMAQVLVEEIESAVDRKIGQEKRYSQVFRAVGVASEVREIAGATEHIISTVKGFKP